MSPNERAEQPNATNTEDKVASIQHLPFEPTVAGAQAPPPYECRGVKVFGFPLLADAAPLRDLCDRYLSMAASAGITFEPVLVGPNVCTVMLEALDYMSLEVTTPPWNDFGEIPQQELLFAVPVLRKQDGQVVESGIFISHIFVDDQASSITGREVLGLPKLMANFSLDPDFPTTGPIVMRLQGRTTKGGPIQLIKAVTIDAPLGLPPLSVGVRIGRFVGPFDSLFQGIDNFADLERAFESSSMFGYSSRILIDPEHPDRDVFQSLIRCTYASTNRITGLLSPATVTLTPMGYLDIARTLGIQTNYAGEALSTNPYYLEADFSLGDVSTLWRS